MTAPTSPVVFGVKGRAALVFATYAGMVASLMSLVGGIAIAGFGSAPLFEGVVSGPVVVALVLAAAAFVFGALSLGMTALLSRASRSGVEAHESWRLAIHLTPRFHRIEHGLALAIAAGAVSLLW